MTGFEAINHYNGWVMSVLGAGIVFSGLIILSIAISQIQKIVAYIERREANAVDPVIEDTVLAAARVIDTTQPEPLDIDQTIKSFQPLADELGDTFDLIDLYKLSQSQKMAHPHLSISALRGAGVLAPKGDGIFTWHPRIR